MLRWSVCAVVAVLSVPLAVKDRPVAHGSAVTDGPGFTADGRLKFPANYREWVFLSSGLDMSYSSPAGAGVPEHSVFNNVFVNPAAYHVFVQTGRWPDGTLLVLENRAAEGNHSINTRGRTQTGELKGLEVHARDTSRPGSDGWGFYNFANEGSASLIPTTEACYTCHAQHAAVDTTFVQFYPTLLPIAKQKGTLSTSFLNDEAKHPPQ